MRTQLSQFCDLFVTAVRPLLAPLDRADAGLADIGTADSGAADTAATDAAATRRAEAVRVELREVSHQVRSLCDKVAGQRSYVLIFGPLKSGKSTLMNAIAASYVSEVSSLPAYPCLVFVSHGDKPEYVVTDYRGKQTTGTDVTALHECIDAAHQELAQHVREAEGAGELFDPQSHFLDAIHRVDVKVAADKLRKSGAVLVDTPGLYTRMRFGYDRMTRDFRNAAACAIFVVKSDTLFLEQVFTEFNQLLELFSRIFLVVNMDATKRDVGPDGKLEPSLEQRSPARIIEAFENLAMPTPLKEAAAAGRVRIFGVDLMQAASDVLQGKAHAAPDFSAFQEELHTYLASTDYLVAFLSDSMQRARQLVVEARQLAEGEFVGQLRGALHNVDSQREACQEELRQLDDCRRLDWSPAFARYGGELEKTLQRVSRDLGARAARDMSAAIETWMLSSHSLQWLLATVWQPLVRNYVEAVRDAARRCFEQSVYQANAGLDFESDLGYFLATLDIDVRALRRTAFAEMTTVDQAIPEIPLDLASIPVRRGLLDIVTLRSEGRLRDRLFGPPDNPDTRISARQKARRLGDPAKKYLNRFLLEFKEEFFAATVAATQSQYADELRDRTLAALRSALEEREPGLRHQVDELELEGSRLRRVLEPLRELNKTCEAVDARIHALHSQYSGTETGVLLTPLPPRNPAAQPTRRETRST